MLTTVDTASSILLSIEWYSISVRLMDSTRTFGRYTSGLYRYIACDLNKTVKWCAPDMTDRISTLARVLVPSTRHNKKVLIKIRITSLKDCACSAPVDVMSDADTLIN